MAQLLDGLPGDYGALLRLRYMADLGSNEIAETAHMSPALVKQRLHQGREILRARLAKALRETWEDPKIVFETPRLRKRRRPIRVKEE